MERDGGQKTGNLRLERGGLYAKHGVRQEIAVEREVRERVYALKLKEKAFRRIAGDDTHPTRKLSELFRKAKRRKATYEQVRDAFIGPLEQDLRYVYHMTGEHEPAA